MGGTNKQYKTAHGTLAEYPSTAASFDAYIALIGSAARWPATVTPGTGLFFKTEFTIDDINRAFNQKAYYKAPAYNADPDSDYGRELFSRMSYAVGPLIVLMGTLIADAPEGSNIRNLGPGWVAELESADAKVKASMAPKAMPRVKSATGTSAVTDTTKAK